MNPSRFWLRWFLGVIEGPRLSLLNFFGDDSQKTTNTNTSYQDSFNKTDSWVRSMADSGNVSLSLGGGSGGVSDVLGQIAPLLFAVFALLGGLYLVTRSKA